VTDKIRQAVRLRRRRDAAAKRVNIALELLKRHQQAMSGYQRELERLVDAMNSSDLKSYWKLCQE
jgi:hypothetical protein